MTPHLRLTESALRDIALADALRGMAKELLHDGDPARLWAVWVADNLADLTLAADRLGVKFEDGEVVPLARMKQAVMHELIVKSKHNG